MKFSKEFKEAISHLPDQEKDKLLFRLLKKDLVLANRLAFELISEKSVDDRRAEVEDLMVNEIQKMTDNYYSPGYLNMDIRHLSGIITEHVKITKDKFGEAYLNIILLKEILKGNNEKIQKEREGKVRKLNVAIISRCFKILLLVHKLHDDYLLELKDDMEDLGQLIGSNHYLMETAMSHGFDVNWLISGNIPEDIVEIHKDLRNRGYLTTRKPRWYKSSF